VKAPQSVVRTILRLWLNLDLIVSLSAEVTWHKTVFQMSSAALYTRK